MNSFAKAIWFSITDKYSSDKKLADKLYQELIKKYSGSNRFYHNWEHVENLLVLTEQFSSALQDKEVIILSVFYHDAVYHVLRKDNEHRSAQLAVKRMQALGFPLQKIELVNIFIKATQHHQIPESMPDAGDLAIFLDFDMSILGADREVYKLYKERVRKEYRAIPAALYRRGRKKFLVGCLESEFIFNTPEFRDSYESRARENIGWELETEYQ